MAASREDLIRALKIARDRGDVPLMREFISRIDALEPQGSALTRFSEAGVGLGANLMDLGQFLSGVPGSGDRAMRSAVDMGITTREAPGRTDLASVAGRAGVGALGGALLRPAAAGAELVAGALSVPGEMAGRAVGGDVGALVGGVGGSLTGAGLASGVRRAVQTPGGAAQNLALREATGAPVGLGEVGGNDFARFIERVSARIPGGSLAARRRATRISLQVASRAEGVGQRLTRAVDPEIAGGAIREGFGSAMERFKTISRKLFTRASNLSAGHARVPANYGATVNKLYTEAQKGATSSARVFNRDQASLIDEVYEAFQRDVSNNPRFDMDKMEQLRSRIGAELANVDIIGTPREGTAKMLYKALTDDMRLLAGQSGPKALKAFENANGFYRGNLEKLTRINKAIVNKQTDSQIFNALFSKGQQGPEILRDLRARIPQEQWDMAVGMVLKRMGRETPGATTAVEAGDAGFSLNRFLTNWAKFNDAGNLKVLFEGKSPALRGVHKDLTQIAKVAAGSRELTQALPNASNTAETQLAGTALVGLASVGFVPEFAAAVGSGIAASTALQTMLSSPGFIKWLATSTRIPVGQLPAHMERLERVIEEEPQARPLAQGIIDRLRP